jgi:hypothetical protein
MKMTEQSSAGVKKENTIQLEKIFYSAVLVWVKRSRAELHELG